MLGIAETKSMFSSVCIVGFFLLPYPGKPTAVALVSNAPKPTIPRSALQIGELIIYVALVVIFIYSCVDIQQCKE